MRAARAVFGSILAIGAASAVLTDARDAHAFGTRIHIVIANKVRDAAIAGGGTIKLALGEYTVTFDAADQKAIVEHPLELRAGAIGPDNMIFPAMTDPSHAIEQRPYEQCQLLYDAAVVDAERAYAIGCFLHGATDAIAHHYVNFMTGETYTFNPITNARKASWTNVVRHVVSELAIQKSAFKLDPGAFTLGNLQHAIPRGFVLRTYMDDTSPLWKVMGKHALEKYEAAKAANPGASMATVLSKAGLAPAEQLVLLPIYVKEIEAARKKVRDDIVKRIAVMQDWTSAEGSKLKVTAGKDGKLGTPDDATSCSASCAIEYANYFVRVRLLAPRYDAGGKELPSAFDKVSDKLGADLFQLLPAELQTIENISAKLNAPLSGAGDGLDLDRADIPVVFAPMRKWADDITTIDYETLARAVTPEWLTALSDAFSSVGVKVSISGILGEVLRPIIQPIKDAVKSYALDKAEEYIGTLIDEYKASYVTIGKEFDGRLAAAAGPGLSGTALDHFFDSGLYVHSFNIAAAAIAKHELILPEAPDVGPATFDASYTPAWMQAGLCGYLRTAIFPLGIDVKGSLTVKDASGTFAAKIESDSPVECHEGSLGAFASAATIANCKLTSLAKLMSDPKGSISRAHPPSFGDPAPKCKNLEIPGLPPPPPPGSEDDAGVPTDDAGNPIDPEATGTAKGCGCRAPGTSNEAPLVATLALAGALLVVARRRRVAAVVASLSTLLAAGCGGGSTTDTPPVEDTAIDTSEEDTNSPDATPVDTGVDVRPDVPKDNPLLKALGDSVWSAEQTRMFGTKSKKRAFELRFQSSSLEWAEIQNPYGPARARELRVFVPEPDGKTVKTTVITPTGWPVTIRNGVKEDWTLEVMPGSPRTLKVTKLGASPEVETFVEGAWPKPTSGLTAFVNVFSSSGKVNEAFCTAGLGSFDYKTVWDFARGKGVEPALGSDLVAGARLLEWKDLTGANKFAVTDVDGFDRLGGTELSDQYDFVVTYRGTIKHPGGLFKMRERDDSVEDAVWSFIGPKVGSSLVSDLFLEVHGYIWANKTPDEPSLSLALGDVPVEIMVVRCAKAIKPVDVEVSLGGGAWTLVGSTASTPEIDDKLFPPAL